MKQRKTGLTLLTLKLDISEETREGVIKAQKEIREILKSRETT